VTPRAELRDRIERIAARHVPHLKVPDQLKYLARIISAESGLSVGAGTVKDWLYALDDDARRVDSRHMDWARARSRTMSANDNAQVRLPRRSEVTRWAA
jgi:hypothetical protein